VDAFHSGFEVLALLLSVTVASLIAGFTVSRLGYYVPHMIVSPIFMAISTEIMTKFTPSTATAKLVGYQILFGFGARLGMQ
jgi:hypothetical protein